MQDYKKEQDRLRKAVKKLMVSPELRGKIQSVCRDNDIWPNNLYLWVNGHRGFKLSTLDKVKKAFGVK